MRQTKAQRESGLVGGMAAACSMLFRFVFTAVSGGFALIISTVVAAAVGAALFPIPEETEEKPV